MKLNLTPEEYSAKAKNLFEQGYNCAQAVLLAFDNITGLDTKTAAALSSSFGGGMGRLREVCGAVSGMFMVSGIVRGYSNPEATDKKAEHYAFIQNLAAEYKEKKDALEPMRDEMREIHVEMMSSDRSYIAVTRTIYPGVVLSISDLTLHIKDKKNYCKFKN